MNAPYGRSASLYLAGGWHPIPLPTGRKHPPPTGYTGYNARTVTVEDVERWTHTGGNVAVHAPDGVLGIDVDNYGDKRGGDTLNAAVGRLGPLPPTFVSSARDGISGIRWFRVPAGHCWAGVLGDAVELIHHGHRYGVVWPSLHPDTGQTYQWRDPDGLPVHGVPAIADLPVLPDAWVAELDRGLVADRTRPATMDAGEVDAWLDALPDGQPCGAMARVLERRTVGLDRATSRHDAGRGGVLALLGLGERGHHGARIALGVFRETWLAVVADRAGGTEGEWTRMVGGAVRLLQGDPTPETERRCCAAIVHAATTDFDFEPAEPAELFNDCFKAVQTGNGATRYVWQSVDTAIALRKRTPVAKAESGLWTYADGVWDSEDDGTGGSKIDRALIEILNNDYTRARSGEVHAVLASHPATPVLPEMPDPRLINVANGMLDWQNGDLLSHSPNHGSRVQLGVRWDPDARCPRFDAWLRTILPKDCWDWIYELVGYLCYAGDPAQAMTILYGGGGNGKSTLLTALRTLLGPGNVSAVGIHDLAGDGGLGGFGRAHLYGKLANFGGDVDSSWLKHTAAVKEVIGGDPITANRKYGAQFDFTSWATNVFAANEPFTVSDGSDGFARRLMVVPFPHKYDGVGRDALWTPAELSGVMVKAVRGLRRVMERGGGRTALEWFDAPASVLAATEAFREESDLVRLWLSEGWVREPDGFIEGEELYSGYRAWCELNGERGVMSSRLLYKRLRSIGVEEHRRKTARGFRLRKA